MATTATWCVSCGLIGGGVILAGRGRRSGFACGRGSRKTRELGIEGPACSLLYDKAFTLPSPGIRERWLLPTDVSETRSTN